MTGVHAATGHRPNKLGGYGVHIRDRLVATARAQFARERPDKGISGMALGWDQAFARACILDGIPLLAAIPFIGQEKIWPLDSQREYQWLLERATEVHVVSEWAGSRAMLQRNKWMVDRCDKLIALWNRSTTGGTAHAVAYAESKRVPMTNLWAEYVTMDSTP